MHDEPFGAALLAAARQTLLQEIAPHLEGRRRYHALMVANAIGIAAREIEAGGAAARAWERLLAGAEGEGRATLDHLVAAIRAGAHDADPHLHAGLSDTAHVAAAIWKPGQG